MNHRCGHLVLARRPWAFVKIPAWPERGSALPSSVHLLHLRGLIRSALNLLKRGQVVIAQAVVIVVDAQAELDHAVDAARELRGLVEVKARGQQRRVEEQPDQILDSLV